jgi:hypothetical protein
MTRLCFDFSRWQIRLALLLVLAPGIKAEPHEPPLQCEISRGAWCIVKGIGEIRFAKIPNSEWNKWTVNDDYWHRRVGIILEKASCPETVADTVEIVQVRSNVRWEGNLWREAVIQLRKDRRCQLRLMVPLDDLSFQKKAASSLTGSVAACIAGMACTDNILSTKVYRVLE